MSVDTRQRMIEATALLLRRGGMSAASFTDVLAASGAARGAIYHHFPDGKVELTREAVVWTGNRVKTNLVTLPGSEPAEVLAEFLDAIRPVVAEAATGVSCAVAAVVLETGQVDRSLTAVASEALQSWVDTLEARLVATGAPAAAAHAVAVLLIVFLEGTQVLCRAAGDMSPFDDGAAAVRAAGSALTLEEKPFEIGV
ncbi:TetR/AcrR family transcriptional regulator [Glaciibacter flavus]|uniref:TetR/AcrR family transcriptional regulator n=1 Tax=Orlajensenia flava TaxID=2565934 RepID=A0A4S4FRM5_9MICO|nr:TetR/AcrR family transcriptional regulator [Glaciibacter flavus]THG32522.1 TetR/AcrR family transcriptional regulator [Glaciibacter flavus]